MPTHPQARAYWFIGFVSAVLASSSLVEHLAAQAPAVDCALPTPRLFTLNPPGGKVGSVVEVAFTGLDLEEPEKLVFSHPGIKAEPIVPPEPPVDPKKPKPATPPAKPPVTKFKVTIAPDVALGDHDARLVNKWGISNPRVFQVGDLAEVQEKEPNNDVDTAQRVELNCTVNGNMAAPTDVDYYVFAGKKGQRVVVSCLASTIDSRFNSGLEIYDKGGKLLAQNHNYHDLDALVDLALPSDGDYYVRVFEFTYTQGTAEHFYRLSISTAPWIDAIFPCVVEPGKPTPVTIYGRNLPGGVVDPSAVIDGCVLEKVGMTVTAPVDALAPGRLAFNGRVQARAAMLDGFEFRLKNAAGASNPYLVTYAKAPVVVDNGANDTPETAQAVSLPCEIAGHVEKRHDRDWYSFSAKKGDIFNFEVLSNRLDAPTYMYFRIVSLAAADGKPQDVYESVDNPDVLAPKFYAGSEDPAPYRFVVPADGKYLLLVASRYADTMAGPRHLYRVRITPDQPDFHLFAVPPASLRPDAALLRQGGSQAITLFAARRDGFAGNIQIAVEGLPPGVTCPAQNLGPALKETTLVLSAAANAAPFTGEIKIKGTAVIRGQTVVREARPGGIIWPAGGPVPALARLERGIWLAVRGPAPYNLVASIDKPVLTPGDKGTLTVNLTRIWPDFKTPLTVTPVAVELPAGLTFNNNAAITIAPNAANGTLPVVVGPTTAPGTYNVVLKTSSPIPYNKDPKAAQKPATLVVQPSTPITVTVMPKILAVVGLVPPAPTVKIGTPTELAVRVTRQFNYDGDYKVQLVLPPAVKDVAAAEVVIPAGKDEGKLMLSVPAGAALGGRAGLIVRVTALYEGKTPVVHDSNFNVNVVK